MREAGVSLSLAARATAIERAALGVLQPLLPPHLRRAPLEPVPQPGFLPAHRRSACRDNLALVIAERDRRPIAARLFVKDRGARCTGATGARSSTCRCCISSAATTRRSSTPSRHRPRGVRRRRARRAQDLPRPVAGRGALGPLAGASAVRARGGGLPASAKARASRATSMSYANIVHSRRRRNEAQRTRRRSSPARAQASAPASRGASPQEGAAVIVGRHQRAAGERIAQEVGGKFVHADVTKGDDWAKLVRAARRTSSTSSSTTPAGPTATSRTSR